MAKPVLSARGEAVARGIVDAAFTVHKALEPGLLERVYEACFCHELGKRKLAYKRQVTVPIQYDGLEFEEGFRIDVLVEEFAICELKAVETMHPVFQAQLMSYMKLADKRLGFLINFHVPLIKQGIKRIVI
ncbi:MAG: GxxExxY protein [Ardenticatenaceae bacterium]|nr:GxxExxY protein [Ardenticatenaceae bacterium]MCB8991135.1 GxxExxY protein [Ardenticatenaceae bacterium]MCB9005291.1 GxxExxY protein [Ardenticatenaceae bacterium]